MVSNPIRCEINGASHAGGGNRNNLPLPKIIVSTPKWVSCSKCVGPEVGKAGAVPWLQRAVGAQDQAVVMGLLVHRNPARAVASHGQGIGFVGLKFHGKGFLRGILASQCGLQAQLLTTTAAAL